MVHSTFCSTFALASAELINTFILPVRFSIHLNSLIPSSRGKLFAMQFKSAAVAALVLALVSVDGVLAHPKLNVAEYVDQYEPHSPQTSAPAYGGPSPSNGAAPASEYFALQDFTP